MKFELFVEGQTEDLAIAPFLKRWLDPQLSQPVGIITRKFQGSQRLWRDVRQTAITALTDPKADDLIGVISLVDLAAQLPFPSHCKSTAERSAWGKEYLEKQVGHPRYRHFFAHHEVEAWLISQPTVFPTPVAQELAKLKKLPEQINFDSPPATLLNTIYRNKTGENYKKIVYGRKLFSSLKPNTAYTKCPSLKLLLDEMLQMAHDAGL